MQNSTLDTRLMSSTVCKSSAGGCDAGSSGDELMGWIFPLFKEADLVELIGRRIYHSTSTRETYPRPRNKFVWNIAKFVCVYIILKHLRVAGSVAW